MNLIFLAAIEQTLSWVIVGCIVPIGLFISGMLVFRARQHATTAAAVDRRLIMLETQMTPFWGAFQKEVAAALHHPHPESKVMDRLLEKLENLTISEEERSELVVLLRKKVDDPKEEEKEKIRAELLLLAMPRVLVERAEQVKKMVDRVGSQISTEAADLTAPKV